MIETKEFQGYKWASYNKEPFWKRCINSLNRELRIAFVIALLFGTVFGFLKIIEVVLRWI